MENLKETAGENVLDQEMMDFVSGGTQAEINELYNFYQSMGVNMSQYGSKQVAVANCLMKDRDLFGSGSMSFSQLNADGKKNFYSIAHTTKSGAIIAAPMNHKEFMTYLRGCYAAGKGHFGK